MTNQSNTFPLSVAVVSNDEFYMIDVDYYREWDNRTIGATYYTEEWDEDFGHSDLIHQGYEVVSTHVV